ncbi:hypothetical protein L2Q67_004727, partial [Salmonella enterica]|nr:hypothetical protein [Salmonella enterica]
MSDLFDFKQVGGHNNSSGGTNLKKLLKNKKFLVAAGAVSLLSLFVYMRNKNTGEEVRTVGIAEYPKAPE